MSAFLSKSTSGTLVLVVFSCIQFSNSYIVDNNPYHHKEVLDSRGRYTLEWLVDVPSKTITFNVTAKTTGFVGFGLSANGRMEGADMVVGGVDPEGRSYFKDMHALSDRSLKLDQKQDWKLLSASEQGIYTFLSFSRPFDTCDEDDYLITPDQVQIIWAYGGNDRIGHHYQNRGAFSAYLLDPSVDPDIDALVKQRNLPAFPTSSGPVQSWRVKRSHRLLNKRTSYWCSIHAVPRLPHKHHIIGFRTYLENEVARLHTHHLLVYRCKAPEGIDPRVLFEPFTRYPGEECNINENRRLPRQLCQDVVSVWGYGGKPFFLPETVGFPIGQDQNEYFLYESHFDNPDLRSDLEFETGVEYFFTPKTRQREGGVLILGFDVPGSLAAIPPGSPAFDVIGQCNPNCTATMSPTGIDVVGVGLHTHNNGRKLRLRHFRNNQELTWLQNDDNYNPTYQQLRLLSHEKKILPGDQLITRCTYDNTGNNGSVTMTGYGTPDEMCLSFVIIANRLQYHRCTSEYPAEKLLSAFGVENVIWDVERQQRLVTSPPSLEGLTLNQVADYHVHWTEELRQYLEKDMMYSPHVTSCPTSAVPSAQTFLASLSPQIARRAASATNQELEEIVRQGVSQLILLGSRGLRQQAEQETEQPIGQDRLQQTEQRDHQQNAGWTSPEYQQQQSPVSVAGTTPVFPQGTPPTGVSGLGVAPNAVFPKNATIYQPPPTCKAPRPPSRQVIKLQDPKISGRSLPNTIIGFNRGKITVFAR